MSTSTSGSYLIQVQATLLGMSVGLFLLAWAFSAHAAQPAADPFARGVDLFKIQIAHSDYQPNKKAGLAGSPSFANGMIETDSLPGNINPNKKITAWITSILWNLDAVGDRASLSPHLRIQSEETLIEVRPLNQSVMILWHKALD